jgi:hypothetical protein
MPRIQDQIAEQTALVKSHAQKWDLPEKDDPLRIVPFVSKRCIVSCGPGRCNCWPTVGHHFCVVFESRLNSCSQEFLSEMGYLQAQVDKLESEESEQGDIINECHVALKLSKP